MARRPNKPHIDGFEDEEDCFGYYDPNEADRRGCHPSWASRGRPADDPCQICASKYRAEEQIRRQAEWDAKTPVEQAAHEAMVEGLKSLY